ncbi:TOBE domain-containing protein [Paraburkholderia bannensis]|uniref:TOBE domain-containing protein n=1 Tax=Paraburkholderia bannensis TaxID=765414 RepID=UPI001FE01708|nr:TOBE domain-containing protein [Paraburkholderia bannensis]
MRFSNGANTGSDDAQLAGKLVDIQYYGAISRFEVRSEAGQMLAVTVANRDDAGEGLPAVGESVTLAWPRRSMVVLEQRG